MSRHLVRSFILASVLGPFVNAGPCKPLSSSTVLVSTTTESIESRAATSTGVVSTSETYTFTSRSEDVSTTTAESPSSTVSESVLFTTTAETSAISSDDTTASQGETTTTAVFEASTTAVSDLASDTTTETAGDTATEISATISSDETSVVSQTATTTTFEDITTTILESSTTEEILPTTTTDITTLTSEAPTTTTNEDVTLTSTEPSETTTEEVEGCKDDKITPPPKNLVCGVMGGRTTNDGYIGLGRTPDSELDCAEECRDTPNCNFFAVKAGQSGFCELWSKVNPTTNFPSPYKWYEPGCFCGSESEPEATTTTQAPEVLPTTTEITTLTSETELPTTTITEDITLTSTEPVETTTEAATICIDNKKSPPPKDLVCSKMGYSSNAGNAEVVGRGRFGSELECAEDCRNTPNCKWLAVDTGPGGFCQLWTGVFSPTNHETSWRWYEPGCFCDSSEPEPEPEATQEPEP
ncbi:hypothetical protein FVEN_g11830 [Fusarium venenatum]|uniref:Apple domain-containing protein n=1 Tax=Fusarium venenatum TaxID=56646 RepID=A0A2L2TV88_9HYPO|nr:uncharacterized protein FVRRES_08293 [Fusarium venenatum]KAG8350017.1 hypothetical protein FVEN_g11830 [Fusarium venenatum]KAH6965081.1 hypothetical protein EDB82DRAFT_540304 [Fusarium venenatum]CEI68216.1 unnamed protein product [Fusarium venenatum]